MSKKLRGFFVLSPNQNPTSNSISLLYYKNDKIITDKNE